MYLGAYHMEADDCVQVWQYRGEVMGASHHHIWVKEAAVNCWWALRGTVDKDKDLFN